MNLRASTWHLASKCPCCGQGEPAFSSCPRCRHVLLICDEVGTVFPNVHDLAQRVHAGATTCPACNQARLSDYVDATSEQIVALGFAPGEYH